MPVADLLERSMKLAGLAVRLHEWSYDLGRLSISADAEHRQPALYRQSRALIDAFADLAGDIRQHLDSDGTRVYFQGKTDSDSRIILKEGTP